MKAEHLEHVLRAAASILGQSDFLVIGSAAILASFPDEHLPQVPSRELTDDLPHVRHSAEERGVQRTSRVAYQE
jgi:hypothetical protein